MRATDSVALCLTGARVTSGFRSSLFNAAARVGLSVNEFVLLATAERLRAEGEDFPGVFREGDFATRQRTDEAA